MSASSLRSSRSTRCLLLLTIPLFLLAFLLFWKPQLVGSASSHISSLKSLTNIDQISGAASAKGDHKDEKAELFESQATPAKWGSDDASDWWAEYSKAIVDGAPNFDEIRFASGSGSRPFATYSGVELSTSRIQRLNMTDEEKGDMSAKHAMTLEKIKQLAPRMPFVPGTRGIVMSTAVDAMAFLTVSLRMLRRTGTTLPVEIWMFDKTQWKVDPWGLRMCNEIYSQLGATCRFVTDHLPKDRLPPYDKPTEKYMNKFDAMMFSSFEQILFLDSDNNALMPVDDLFQREPFKSNGMVLWPDYWKDWASPYFYDITGIPLSSIFDRASTESGQVMINKGTHAAALLMASYYGRYVKHYIRLLEQDPVSDGDKECFLRAAQVSNLSFYQVSEPPDRIGYRCNGDQKAIASGQHHPEDDYYMQQLGLRRGHNVDTLNDGSKPRTLFIHGNLPKYDPVLYMHWGGGGWNDQLRCDDGKGKAHRMWGDKGLTILKHGWDAEKALWDQMRWTSCETEYLQVQWWSDTWWNNWNKTEHVCESFTSLYEELLGEGGEGLHYDPLLTPAPFDERGEATIRSKQWTGSRWDSILTSSTDNG